MLQWARHRAHCPGHTGLDLGHSPSPACESGRTESCPRWLCPRHAALTRTPPSSTWQRVELWGPGGLWGCGAAWRVGSWLEQGRGPPVPALLPLSSRPPSSLEAAVCWSGKASWEESTRAQHPDILGGLRGRRYRGGWALPLEATPLARWACAPSKKSRVSSGSGVGGASPPPPPGMGGASRSQGGVSARLHRRGHVGALSQPGEGPRPGARGGAVAARGGPAAPQGRPAPGTLVGAEAPLAVVVVAVRGGAPQLAVAAAFAGAALVLFAQEGEGEDAGRAFRVPANSGHDCGVGDTRHGQRGAQAPRHQARRQLTSHP